MYQKLLKSNKKSIGVWGTGYIGLSTMVYFARENIKTIGFDIDNQKVKDINSGILPIPELESWFGFKIDKLVEDQYLSATSDYKDLINENIIAHFIAIPTEKDGKPYFKILEEILVKITELKKLNLEHKPLIIVESTLTPKTTEKMIMPIFQNYNLKIGADILFAVAPRRDWFVEGNKSLRELDRVFGAADEYSTKETKNILEIVCDKLHVASSYRVSEMVKSIENAYRHMEITLANQLSIAYPDENMREVLKLVGTKWNIGTFYPGFGSGGYCIPLSSQYVLQEIEDESKLTLLRETIKTDNEINILIAKSIIKKGYKNIGILGISYKGNLKVSILSPIIPFVNELKKHAVNVELFDPYFSNEEIKKLVNIESFNYPSDLNKFDAIVVSVDHDEFKETNNIKENLKNCKYILDNLGVWNDLNLSKLGIEYHISGDKNWIN
jgi:nucleotide sugar dehydrogenase